MDGAKRTEQHKQSANLLYTGDVRTFIIIIMDKARAKVNIHTFAQKEGPVYIVSTHACIGPLTHSFKYTGPKSSADSFKYTGPKSSATYALVQIYRSEEQRRLFKKSLPLMFCMLAFFVGKGLLSFLFMRSIESVCRLDNAQILNNLKVQVYPCIQRRGCTCTSRHHFQSNILSLAVLL